MDRKIVLGRDEVAINAETDYGSFPVEPLNAVSNLCFLIVIYYWIKKTRCNFGRYPLIVISMPIIFVGIVAGIIHHLFRVYKVWNTITMLSVFYLVIMLCVYLWYRIAGRWFHAFIFTMIIPVSFWITTLSAGVVNKLTVPIVFAAFSVALIIPAMVLCIKNKLKHLELIGGASFLFFVGMLFRIVDMQSISVISRGTHFLWHILGAATLFVVIKFIYLIDESRAEEKVSSAEVETAKES